MKLKDLVLILSLLLALTGCQVKKGAGSGGLFSDHTPTTNRFTLQQPAAKTYVSGETLSLNVDFPFDVEIDTTGGSPRLELDVGGQVRYATLVSGAGTRNLVFEYVIGATDNASAGVIVKDLETNGSVMTFDNDGVITPCDVSTVPQTTLTNVVVDNTAPAITGFTTTSSGFQNPGEVLGFTVTYNEPVVVTGNPSIQINLDSGIIQAYYASGSGTNVLTFSHTVVTANNDTNGFNAIGGNILLNTGTLKDSVGNNASRNISTRTGAVITMSQVLNIFMNGNLPYVVRITPPANGTYIAAQNLDFVVEFNVPVFVTLAVPYILIDIGPNPRQVAYYSGSGTKFLTFRYTTIPGDVDLDGITVPVGTITRNAANIRDASNNEYFQVAANNLFTVPSTSGVIINSVQPQPISISRNVDMTNPTWLEAGQTNPDQVWNIGQTLLITVGFNTVMKVTQTNGSPTIPITIGGVTKQATYLSGDGQTSLIFRYVIEEGDSDTDGSIALGSIALNNGVIADNAQTNTLLTLPAPNALTNTYIDGIRPTISSLSVPAAAVYSNVAPYTIAEMQYGMVWDEKVNISSTVTDSAYFEVNIGTDFSYTAIKAQWNPTTLNNRTNFTFRPTTNFPTNLNDTDNVKIVGEVSGTAAITDQAGNTAVRTFVPPTATNVHVDTQAPTVASVTPVNGMYVLSDNVDFNFVFNEPVTTNKAGNYPRVDITLDSSTARYAEPISSSPTPSLNHTFRYQVQLDDNDLTGVVIENRIQNQGTGYLYDKGRNPAANYTVPNTSAVLVDAKGPQITSVSKPANGTYNSATLEFNVTFDEAVTVAGTGTHQISTPAQSNSSLAFTYVGGSGTTILTYRYNANGTVFDFDGLGIISAITIGGTITLRDVRANNAVLNFNASADLTNLFLAYTQIKVWGHSTNSFINTIPGQPAMSFSGSASPVACGTKTCTKFSGDDSISLASDVNNIDSYFTVINAPDTLADQYLFRNNTQFVENNPRFDMYVNGGVSKDNGALINDTANYVDANINLNAFHILRVDYDNNNTLSSGILVPTTYTGAVGEIILMDGADAGQKTQIYNYLNTKY